MAEVLTDAYFDDNTPAMLVADAKHARDIEWRGIYLTVAANIQYYYLMTGIGPTSLCNRMGGDVSIGSGILQGYGEEQYQQWKVWVSGENAEPVYEFTHDLYPHMDAGIEVKEQPITGFAHINEGDDTVVCIPLRKDETNSEAVTHFSKCISAVTQEVWEPAFVDQKHLDSHGGPRSCVEVTSMIVAQVTTEDGRCEFAHVPKPIKRLDKMAWTLSSSLRVIETPAGRVGVADSTYYRLNATRCLSMCTEMRYALFTRYVIYNTAKFHLQKLRALARDSDSDPSLDRPLYNDRTMEARNMPEASGFIGDSIEQAFEKIGSVFARTNVNTKVCLEANANAWGLVSPAALKDGKLLRNTLLQLDQVAQAIEIDEDVIKDPVLYLSMLELGPLESCFSNMVGRLSRAVDYNEKSSLPLDVLRKKLVESVSVGQKSAKAQSQPGARQPSGGQDRGALERCDKGGKAAGPYPKPSRKGAKGAGAARW